MWKEITDAQKTQRSILVSRKTWSAPKTLFWINGAWCDGNQYYGDRPTHYWDFGLDTPLPPPPKGE